MKLRRFPTWSASDTNFISKRSNSCLTVASAPEAWPALVKTQCPNCSANEEVSDERDLVSFRHEVHIEEIKLTLHRNSHKTYSRTIQSPSIESKYSGGMKLRRVPTWSASDTNFMAKRSNSRLTVASAPPRDSEMITRPESTPAERAAKTRLFGEEKTCLFGEERMRLFGEEKMRLFRGENVFIPRENTHVFGPNATRPRCIP